VCCALAGLVDPHPAVAAAAASALCQALGGRAIGDKNSRGGPSGGDRGGGGQRGAANGAALLFEVAFSAELPARNRHPVAAALLKVLKQLQVRASIHLLGSHLKQIAAGLSWMP